MKWLAILTSWLKGIQKGFTRFCAWVLRYVLGWKFSSSPGSDLRRLFVRLCLFWSVLYFFGALSFWAAPQTEYSTSVSVAATTLILASLIVFFQTVVAIPFRDDGDEFRLNAPRLLRDTLVSGIFMILTFSVLYRNTGLLTNNELVYPNAIDAIYFSSVTFSTLGYGDFAPAPAVRLIAAGEALLGSIHMGMIVGATFAAIRKKDR